MAKSILVINGPNLNLLGYREPHIYGSTTLKDIQAELTPYCAQHGVSIDFFQANSEGAIVDRIHACRYGEHLPGTSSLAKDSGKAFPPVDAIVINAGAFTHTSVALRDALGAIAVPFIEVHVSNVHAREEFRHKSFLADKATAVICGLGTYGYTAAVEYCIKHLKVK
ncbi:protein of unknown function [Taphrina deformans PYCC 5710]|uniref:Catabolic 3-dehydroquinase n=1 Tax=Taphrina deformans (strain PYCC 5710 / ATCC 11124 / CBS 356.35 / IMI 108563 / JCM 9778 / NBRC 8474) TaxID=1097556 RepID=R4XF14_TAPDE|nr:protein of unknown function [Taphrina deformans PYCC 5710]|eukprot:CCG84457.1 protein of unknown function [Taphrina deformans PYCC 5710]